MQPRAIIVGAGIGGLACALGLQRAGWAVRVHERASGLLEVGAGLTLSPNATRALEWLGCLAPLAGALSLPPYQIMEDAATGRETGRMIRGAEALRQYGAPYAFVHRADLRATLAGLVRGNDGAAIVNESACTRAGERADRAVALFEDGHEEEADVVIGCDGIRSCVRKAIDAAGAPRFTGYVAWRTLVPYERLAAESLPAGSAVVFAPNRAVVRYRLEPKRLLNVVAFQTRARWAQESWSVRGEPEELRRAFADWHGGIREVLEAVSPDSLFRWGLFDRPPMSRYARGRLAVLGDAAHPMLPFLGQGAALALEDAVVLSRLLGTQGDPAAALARYDRLRRPRGTAAVLESRAAGRRMDAQSDYPPERNEETLDYFRYDAGTVDLADEADQAGLSS